MYVLFYLPVNMFRILVGEHLWGVNLKKAFSHICLADFKKNKIKMIAYITLSVQNTFTCDVILIPSL